MAAPPVAVTPVSDGIEKYVDSHACRATSTTYSFTATSSENGDEFYVVFTNGTGSATTNTVTLTVTAALAESSNWFGCVDLDATFGAVGASWTVLTLDCSGKASS